MPHHHNRIIDKFENHSKTIARVEGGEYSPTFLAWLAHFHLIPEPNDILSWYEQETGKSGQIQNGNYSAKFRKWSTPFNWQDAQFIDELERELQEPIPIFYDVMRKKCEFGALISKNRILDIRVWNKELTTLPPSLGNLTSLHTLVLQQTQLSSLPSSICNLTSLQHLSIDMNELKTLPDQFSALTSLQTLSLDGNQLSLLPERIIRFNQSPKQ